MFGHKKQLLDCLADVNIKIFHLSYLIYFGIIFYDCHEVNFTLILLNWGKRWPTETSFIFKCLELKHLRGFNLLFHVLQLIQSVFSLIQESESEPDISESYWFNHLRRKKMQRFNLFLNFPKITEKKMNYVTTLHRKKNNLMSLNIWKMTQEEKSRDFLYL